MKHSNGFLTECDRFERNCDGPPRTERGLSQFHERESRGVEPADPDSYYLRLLNGKKWWEWMLNDIADSRFTDRWDGWVQLAIDWKDDPRAFKQIRQRCGELAVDPVEFLDRCGCADLAG